MNDFTKPTMLKERSTALGIFEDAQALVKISFPDCLSSL